MRLSCGWLEEARHSPSPNFNERPEGCEISLLVIHNISLPPGEFGGGHIRDLFLNRLDPRAHPYFVDVAGLKVSAHLLIRRDGEVIQYFGDGSLSLFSSTVQAVDAAIDIQRALDGDPALRIGLHAGEVAYDAQGVYGDAVNIAARLEPLAEPGGICISGTAFDQVHQCIREKRRVHSQMTPRHEPFAQ